MKMKKELPLFLELCVMPLAQVPYLVHCFRTTLGLGGLLQLRVSVKDENRVFLVSRLPHIGKFIEINFWIGKAQQTI